MQEQTDTKTMPVTLTDAAAAHVGRIMAGQKNADQSLRIAVVTGGCSGNEYALTFVDNPEDGDIVYDWEGLRICIEGESVDKLAGTQIDYVAGKYGGGIRFTNPKATHECGCGTSFSTE